MRTTAGKGAPRPTARMADRRLEIFFWTINGPDPPVEEVVQQQLRLGHWWLIDRGGWGRREHGGSFRSGFQTGGAGGAPASCRRNARTTNRPGFIFQNLFDFRFRLTYNPPCLDIYVPAPATSCW